MSRFDIQKQDDRLTLTLPPPTGQFFTVGCLLLVGSLLCLSMTGLLGLVYGDSHASEGIASETLSFFNPRTNHFGFLWLVGSLTMLVLLPVYVARLSRSDVTFIFDRAEAVFRRNGKIMARLPRIESVRIREQRQADGRFLYRLFVIHNDGYEVLIDESSEERETQQLGTEIASFLNRRLDWT